MTIQRLSAISANCLLLLFIPFAIFAEYDGTQLNANLNAARMPDHITLTWIKDAATTQTITWRTNTEIETGSVEYAAVGKNGAVEPAKSASAALSKFIDPVTKGTQNVFSVTLTGLEPGKTYSYKAGSGSDWSGRYTFTTEAKNADHFKFLVFGDSQSGDANKPNYAPWHKTVMNAFEQNKDAKFIVNMGDLTESGQTYMHWNNWFEAAKGVIDSIPEMPVQGNHETYGQADPVPVNFKGQFNLPVNGPKGLKGQTYSYNYGNVHFVVLDSQEEEEDSANFKAGNNSWMKAQAEWLDQDLSASKQQWTIVMFHKTPYYNKASRANEFLKATVLPVIDKHKVDVVFNGHDHGISRTYPLRNDVMFSRPEQGTVYYVAGRSGNKYYTDLSPKVWDAFFYDCQKQPCYLSVQVNGTKLSISAIEQDGSLIDTYSIDKKNDNNSTLTKAPAPSAGTRVALFGNIVSGSGSTVNTPISAAQTGGEWFINAAGFLNALGGVKNSDGSYTAGTAVLPASKITNGNISAETIKTLFGFSSRYDAGTNILFFAK